MRTVLIVLLLASIRLAGAETSPSQAELLALISKAGSVAEARTSVAGTGIEKESSFIDALIEQRQSQVCLELGAVLATDIHDPGRQALASLRLGDLQRSQLKYSDADAALNRSISLYLGLGDTRRAAIAKTTLSLVTRERGEMAASLRLALEGAEMAERNGDDLTLGRAYSAAGSAAERLGNYRAALGYHQRALALAEKLGNLQGQAAVLNNLGIVFKEEFDYDSAAIYLERSLRIKRQLGPGGRVASTLNNLGQIAIGRGRPTEAATLYHQSVEAASPQEDDVRSIALMNLGLLAVDRKDRTAALALFREALAIADRIGNGHLLAEAYVEIGNVQLQQRDLVAAGDSMARAREWADRTGMLDLTSRVAEAQGRLALAEGNKNSARANFDEAIRCIEEMRSNVAGDERVLSAFEAGEHNAWESMISLEATSGHSADAFRYAESAKSRVLLDVLTNGYQNPTRFLTPAEQQRNASLLARMSSSGAKPAELTAVHREYSLFRTTVYAAHPELARRRSDPEPISVTQAGALIPDERTALLSYSVGEEQSWLFVLVRSGGKPTLRVHPLNIGRAKLAPQVSEWRRQIASRELGFSTLGSSLYNVLLKPAEAELTGRDRIVVSPDGPIWQLPFEALQDHSGRFMVERADLFYAPSLTVLSRMIAGKKRSRQGDSVLALGDPSGDLPEATQEVAAIGRIYGPARSRIRTGPAATKETLRNEVGGYSVLHVAAHGVYDDANPLYSYLSLAGTDLEAREIMDFKLDTRLVVLSGCETGRNANGGGIAGMAWAFFVAGSPATVASLWKVDSRSSAALMTSFYTRLARGSSISAALREAKSDLLRDPNYRHPFYWAAFVGIGAGY